MLIALVPRDDIHSICVLCLISIDDNNVLAKTPLALTRKGANRYGYAQCSDHDISLAHVDYHSALCGHGTGEPYRVPDCLDCLGCLPVVLEDHTAPSFVPRGV